VILGSFGFGWLGFRLVLDALLLFGSSCYFLFVYFLFMFSGSMVGSLEYYLYSLIYLLYLMTDSFFVHLHIFH